MSEKDHINTEAVEEASSAFGNAASQLGETMDTVKKLAQQMSDGALQGKPGDAFVGAINGPLTKKLNGLKNKMTEMQKDLKKAIQTAKQTEQTSKGDVQR